MELLHFSTSSTKKEKKKQKEKEIPAATNLKFRECCIDKREQFLVIKIAEFRYYTLHLHILSPLISNLK